MIFCESFIIFWCLSIRMREHAAVNRRVVGSSPTWGATKPRNICCEVFFYLKSAYNYIGTVLTPFKNIERVMI